jgi:hypothetical protein
MKCISLAGARLTFLLAGLVGLAAGGARGAQAEEPKLGAFADFYSEGTWCGATDATRGVLYLRGGQRPRADWEQYVIVRAGADQRSFQTREEIQRRDEFLFSGLGFTYLGLPAGLTFQAQAGYSMHLNASVPVDGFDARVGFVADRNFHWYGKRLNSESYGEAIYVHRRRDFLPSVQTRVFYDLGPDLWPRLAEGPEMRMGPMVTLIGHTDTAGRNDSRYLELRAGVKWEIARPMGVFLYPQYVWGRRWAATSSVGNYGEARVLAAVFTEF